MYMLFAWSIAAGPNASEVRAAAFAQLPPTGKRCEIVKDHVLILRARSNHEDEDYERTLLLMANVRNHYGAQFTFALQLTDDHYFDGAGFDEQLAREITG